MKVPLVFVTLFTVSWMYPQIKNHWNDFPMRRMFIDPEILDNPDFHPGVKIVDGKEVTPHEIPYQVWLIFRISAGSNGWSCGGSLITRRFVLTAAHCIIDAGLVEVYLGVHNTSDAEPDRIMKTSIKMIRHGGYIPSNITNDVGVIDLEEEVEINEYINIVRLPGRTDADQLYEGESVRISGWGRTVANGNLSEVLLAVNSTVISNAECKAFFSIVQDTEICISGAEGVGICSGDSGGPLVAGDVQIGIVSYGTRDCVHGYPSVFTRIVSYLSWIQDNSDYVVED